MRQLRRLLAREFPRVARQVGQRPLPAFENYIGRGPSIRAYPCAAVRCGATLAAQPFDSRWAAFPLAVCRFWAGTRAADAARPFPFNATLHPVPPNRAPPPALAWRAVRGGAALYFCLEWKAGAAPGGTERPEPDEIRLAFEPLRLGPAIAFVVGGRGAGAGMNPLETREESRGDTTRLTAVVPFRRLGPASRPRGRAAALRVHVSRFFSPITDPLCFTGSPRLNSWAPVRLTLPRNVFGYSDPGAYGWLTFGPAARRPRSVKE